MKHLLYNYRAILMCLAINNIIEQDHRHIKRIIKPIMGFKSFLSAKATIAGYDCRN